ncbi:MAG: S9 family peptidase [Myxococcota bacterium]
MKNLKLWALSLSALSACASAGEPGTTATPITAAAEANAAPAAPARPAPIADPTLIPRTVFSGNPDYAMPQVNPEGTLLGYLAPVDGVLNVWIAPLDKPTEGKPLTHDQTRPVRIFGFLYDKLHAYYLQDKGGDENFHLFLVDLKTGESKDVTDLPKVRAEVISVSRKKPAEIIIGLNDRDERFHDLYKVDLATGARTLLFKNDQEYGGFLVDTDNRPRLAFKATPDGGAEYFELDAKGKASSFMKLGLEDESTTNPVSFDAEGNTLYLLDSRGRDTSGLFAFDMKKKKATLLVDDARADVSDVITDPKTGKVQAAAVEYERKELRALDKKLEPHLATLKAGLKGDFNLLSRSDDDKHWVIVEFVDDGAAKFHHYDTQAKKLSLLFVNRKSLEGLPLTKMWPRVLKSRDGLNLVSYLSLPKAADPDLDGRPDQPLPLVLLVHGGPWGRDSWGYRGTNQWLASRGYAVLSVNFRGSTGFGKSFLNAANKEWAGKMHDDLIDAVNWAIAEKVADPAKVAIMGGSYGGYSTLVGLTFTPTTFACGVDIVGPSNLATLMASIPPYWAPVLDMFIARIGGDMRTPDGKAYLESRSPLSKVDQIQRPLLIGQGANDPRVKQAESDQIVKAMQAHQIPVSYVLFPDEGHGFGRPENRLAFDAVTEAFLADCLGGKYLPVGKDFSGSTIQVPVGAENIAGIAEALKAQKP